MVEKYTKKDDEFIDSSNKTEINNVWTITNNEERVYSFNEAMELAGNGRYNICLLIVSSLSLIAMSVDLFGFPVTVTLSSCDLELTSTQINILVSLPFFGHFIMAYPWGYLTDTKGRKKTLHVAMFVSFLMSSLSAFATSWIMLGFLKLIGACCGCAAMSISITLLGESCVDRLKSTYVLVAPSVMHYSLAISYATGYFILNLDFRYDMGGMTFVPWRLLPLLLSIPLGLSAFFLCFFYESPKFLINAGREDEALYVLRQICKRNGRDQLKYPVKKVVLNEIGNFRSKDVTILQSMWRQIAPLFRPPLLMKTLMLFYLITIIFSMCTLLAVWLPFLSKSFTNGISDGAQSICLMIAENANATLEDTSKSAAELPLVICTAIASTAFCIMGNIMSMFSSRKKATLMVLHVATTLCCIGAALVPNSVASIIFYFSIYLTGVAVGVPMAYIVEMYPTSVRGMMACMGVMVGRLSSVIAINSLGSYLMTYCSIIFYLMAFYIFSGVFVVWYLPTDKQNKVMAETTDTEQRDSGRQ